MNRRHFLLTTAGTLASLAFDKLWAGEGRGRGLLAQILPAGGADRDIASRGALLAAEEAARAAELLGFRLELRVRDPGHAAALIDEGACALIGGLDAPTRAALSDLAEARGVPLLTTRAPGDAGDDEPLRAHVFHVASGPRDRRAALERWRAREGSASVGKVGKVEVADWHPSLARFGAEQLNQRYRERFGVSMEPLAWTSWMAVKAAAEAVLRGAGLPEQAPADLSRRLATLGFDGHKGTRLRFRPDDHRLHQPLYAIAGGRVLAEIPPEDEQE
jgi:ABC-type branched-subunit amino acid transport system substrate-binding protein